MASLLLYIGENMKFDVEPIKTGLLISPRVRPQVTSTGCVFSCEYHTQNDIAGIRILGGEETIAIDGTGEASLMAAVEIQRLCDQPVHVIDQSYSFDFLLDAFSSAADLERAMREAQA